MPESPRRKPWVTPLLLAAVAAIFALSMALAPRPAGDGQEAFAGTDSVVTEMLADNGVTPWFEPLFEPGSGEVESGLFALQAGLGGGLLGYALGNLRGRHQQRREDQDAAASREPAA
ncbi:energy-coupling factor ABC transporter substrate-binding protein [Luteococcus sp.]|uniref:energy-coupling factor ABC transporter substrate-binding protein n=1 Tax=Luteococcus sp. TaxID=1969402 RepID=UPI003735F275